MSRQGYREALELFASLADDRRRQGRASVLDVSGRASEWQWEGMRHAGLFYQEWYRPQEWATALGSEPVWATSWSDSGRDPVELSELPPFNAIALSDRKKGHRLDAVDRLRRHEEVLRAGWMWLCGTAEDPETGKPRAVCCPLLSVPVHMTGVPPMALNVKKAGDVRFHPLTNGKNLRGQDLLPVPYSMVREAVPKANWPSILPKLMASARALAADIGFSIDEVLASDTNPRGRRTKPGLALVPGVAVYADPYLAAIGAGQRLRNWANRSGVSKSAFYRVYEHRDPRNNRRSSRDAVDPGTTLRQTRILNRDQLQLVQTARDEPLLAVTGPPGTGKTHALCEVALDAIGRGQSVLIGAKSSFAVEVLARQLASVDGPVPVLFGGTQSGNEFASRMSDLLAMATHFGGQADEAKVDEASEDLAGRYRRIAERAEVESLVRELELEPERCRRLQSMLDDKPNLVDELTRFIEADRGGLGGWWHRRRGARALALSSDDVVAEALTRRRELDAWRRLVRADAHRPGAGLHEVDAVDAHFHNARLDADLVAAAVRAEDRCWDLNAQWLRSVMLKRLSTDRRGRQVLQQIATATRMGRGERRKVLEQLDAEALSDAAPLWLGTVGDIDDVLPTDAAMFDLLILDEASQIDQPAAAGALLRASRAIVCGDPRQLRHVSFVGEEGRSADGLIDVGRDSIFDRAAGAAPLISLQEHYRCDPHLIDFSARRFYEGNLGVATRNPGNDGTDLIDVHVVDGTRSESGVNRVEIDAVLRLLRDEPISGGGTIGVVTPFRAQADALTDAVIEQVPAAKIEHRGIEVGTVHAFQGAEFDTVIASWAVDDPASGRAWSFVNYPSLFNVMVTRARTRMVVITSVANPPGLAGDYVRHGAEVLGAVGAEGNARTLATSAAKGWVGDVASVLVDAGFEVETGYQVGRYEVDVVLRNVTGPNGEPVAVCCLPGERHLDRELLLHRLGWHVVYAFRGEWSGRLTRLAIELNDQLTKRDH